MTASILKMISEGADIVCCTGGMSVDPDDKTPLAIKNTGARIVSYGAPVLPGAMFLLAYYTVTEGDNPRTVTIMGLPGCVMYAKRTIFDLVLPHVMADDEVTKEDLASLRLWEKAGCASTARYAPSPTAVLEKENKRDRRVTL